MKDLRPIRGARYIASLIEQGEHEHQDFKYAISDARKIARSISAFANNDGGRLLIGIKDNGVIAGVRNEEDIFVVEQAAGLYCSPEVELRFTAFRCEGQLTVIRAEIEAAGKRRPVMAQEPDGRWRAYYRVADENIAAHPLMVRAWRQGGSGAPLDAPMLAAATDLLSRAGSLTPALLAGALAIPKARAEDMIISLLDMGLAAWAYRGGQFVIIPDTSTTPDQ